MEHSYIHIRSGTSAQEIGKRRLKVNEDRVNRLFLVMKAFAVYNYAGTQRKPFEISYKKTAL